MRQLLIMQQIDLLQKQTRKLRQRGRNDRASLEESSVRFGRRLTGYLSTRCNLLFIPWIEG